MTQDERNALAKELIDEIIAEEKRGELMSSMTGGNGWDISQWNFRKALALAVHYGELHAYKPKTEEDELYKAKALGRVLGEIFACAETAQTWRYHCYHNATFARRTHEKMERWKYLPSESAD